MATVTKWQVRVEHTRLWCGVCQTSGLMTVDVYLLRVDGVRHQGKGERCITCQPFTTDEG